MGCTQFDLHMSILKLSHLMARVWKNWAPSKIQVFSWQLLLGRIPTRANLLMCRVITDPASYVCALCGVSTELANHLFVLCGVASKVWYEIHKWLGWEWVFSRNLVGLFERFLGLPQGDKIRWGFLLIWHIVVWSIWTYRNDLLFSIRCTLWRN